MPPGQRQEGIGRRRVDASSSSVESHAQGPGSASEHLSCLFGGEALPGHQEQRLAVGFGHSRQDRQGFGSLGCGDARVWSCRRPTRPAVRAVARRAAPPQGAVMVADVPAGHGDQPGQGLVRNRLPGAPCGEEGRSGDVVGGVATNVSLRVGDDSSDVCVPACFELPGVHVRSVPRSHTKERPGPLRVSLTKSVLLRPVHGPVTLDGEVGVLDGLQVTGGADDAEAEQIADAADVAAGGVDLAQDAVLASAWGRSVMPFPRKFRPTGTSLGAVRRLMSR